MQLSLIVFFKIVSALFDWIHGIKHTVEINRMRNEGKQNLLEFDVLVNFPVEGLGVCVMLFLASTFAWNNLIVFIDLASNAFVIAFLVIYPGELSSLDSVKIERFEDEKQNQRGN